MALRITFFAIAAVLLAAHFLRTGNLAVVAACLGTPLLFLHRKRWVLLVLQVLAYGAAASWVIVTLHIVQTRLQTGQPFKLAAIILGGVALFTLVAGLLLNSPKIRQRYPL